MKEDRKKKDEESELLKVTEEKFKWLRKKTYEFKRQLGESFIKLVIPVI